jgi:hypothetical protein
MLTINFNSTDYTRELADMSRDTVTLSLDDYLYIGYYKPFSGTHFELSTDTEETPTLEAEYYNGAWTEFTPIDDTKAFSRSGFMQWGKPTDWKKSTVASNALYWIRLKPSTTTEVTFTGCTLVFSSDQALKTEFAPILNEDYLFEQPSHILTHIAVRNHIIQKLRNKGFLKWTSEGYEKLTPFDVLDIYEIKEAATALALSKIFFNLSDTPDDTWSVKSKAYEDRFNDFFSLALLTLDTDDDGASSESDKKPSFSTVRLIR